MNILKVFKKTKIFQKKKKNLDLFEKKKKKTFYDLLARDSFLVEELNVTRVF